MRIWMTIALAAVLAVSVTGAGADPWPSWYAQTYTVDYVDVVPVFNSGSNTWTFQLSVDSGATDPTWGAIDPTYGGVKTLVAYQLTDPLQPDYYAGFGGYPLNRSGWDINGGWETHPSGWGAVGWRGSDPASYVHPGESDNTSFWAHWTGDTPAGEDFVYLVHIVTNSDTGGQTFWARVGDPYIPEPASIILLGLGGLGLAGIRRRKK
ncbi:MAG: PEP-CTERM sorting domain-containing protein [Armatimonadota bacterium]|nr:MAG: PEP-CTERM sorting domain-containing protein [Armatimonadota bacterium]